MLYYTSAVRKGFSTILLHLAVYDDPSKILPPGTDKPAEKLAELRSALAYMAQEVEKQKRKDGQKHLPL